MAKEKIGFNFTFFDIAYSLGGALNVDVIFKVLQEIYIEEKKKGEITRKELLSEKEQKVLECMVETYRRDNIFPSWTYMQQAFNIVSNAPIRNLGDFNTAINGLFETRSGEYLKAEVSNAMAKYDDAKTLQETILRATEMFKHTSDVVSFKVYESVKGNYTFALNAPQGISSGIEVIDRLTAGFQQGTVASIAGFTSHGKSTLGNNLAYINASLGKKVGVVSLEIIPLLCKYIYLSRHSYKMNKPIEYQTLIRTHLTDSEMEMVFKEIEPDFMENVGKNLCIVGTEDVPEYSAKGFELLYSKFEETLGGLDLVIWDHVNQFKYVNPNSGLTGDHYIKFLTDLTKTYVNKNGVHPVTLFIVQCNREGYKIAKRKDGRYDLTALSDFNELEKSSTYVIFIFADEKNRMDEQAKVQLLKHRLGMIMLDPEVIDMQFKYSMVGKSFNEVISLIKSERDSGIRSMFFSGDSGDYTSFDFKQDVQENKNSIVDNVHTQETVEKSVNNGYTKKIIDVNSADFETMF